MFYGCIGLTSITIPKSVTSIKDLAFYGCYKLVEVYNQSSLSLTGGSDYGYVGYYAKAIYTSDYTSKISITEDGYVLYTDGNGVTLLRYDGPDKALTLPTSVTSIGDRAFYNRADLTFVQIPNGVTSIGRDAFYGCTGLTSLTLPDSLASIGYSAFYGCTGLTSVTIPGGARSIGDHAFYECTALTSVTIGGGALLKNAFGRCKSLTSVTLGSGVTSFREDAFVWCNSLISITVQGTKADWAKIYKESGWDKATGHYTIHCTDGDITK